MIYEFSIRTENRQELVDVTSMLAEALKKSGVSEGVVTAFVPHTTAAVTINENADPSVKRDILTHLSKLIPERGDFHHAEGNSDAHLKSSLFGSSERVLVDGGKLLLGTWQSVFFAEFDGPRTRRLYVQVSKG